MQRGDYSSRVWWFTLSVVLGVVALGIIPPFDLWGMTTARVDVMSDLRAENLDSETEQEYIADIERLEMELATLAEEQVVEVDTLPELPAVRYEWIESSVVKERRRAKLNAGLPLFS